MASATIACIPALMRCDGDLVVTVVVVTHEYLADATSFAFCVPGKDEATGRMEVAVFDEADLRPAARS